MSKSLFPQSRTIGRYTQIAINLGFTSRQMFDKAKQDIGAERPTAIQLAWWLNYAKHPKAMLRAFGYNRGFK